MLVLSLAVTATRRAAELLDDEEGGGIVATLLNLVGDVLPFVFTGAVILFLYCVLPMQRQRPKDVWPGVVVAVLLLALLREGLELYFEHLADFGALYGSLGALMALLLFVYAAAMVLLFQGMQSSLSMVYDREVGSMRVLLTSPLPRWWRSMPPWSARWPTLRWRPTRPGCASSAGGMPACRPRWPPTTRGTGARRPSQPTTSCST